MIRLGMQFRSLRLELSNFGLDFGCRSFSFGGAFGVIVCVLLIYTLFVFLSLMIMSTFLFVFILRTILRFYPHTVPLLYSYS